MSFFTRHLPPYLLIILLIAVALLLPSLSAGLIADDWWHIVWIQGFEEHPAPRCSSPFDLFSFVSADQESRDYLLERGGLPWWASESITLNFWRPVAELSHWDYRLFGLNSIWLHVHSIAWFAAFLAVLNGFYRRLGLSKWLTIAALLIVVTEPFHTIAVTWLANRNISIAAFFVFLSLNCFLDAREKANRLLYALCFYALALLSSEAATSLLAFLIAYLLCLDTRPVKERLLAFLPFFLLSCAWFLLYRYLAYGASGNAAMYVDPVAQPMVFIKQFIERVPVALNLQLLVLPKLFPEFWSQQLLRTVGLGMLVVGMLVAYLSRSRYWCFALIAFVLALVPLASALLHERNFIFVSAALAPLVALLIQFFWTQKSYFLRSLAVFIVLYKMVLGTLLCLLAIWYFAVYSNGEIKKTARSLPDSVANKHVLLLGAPVLHSSFIYPMRLVENKTLPLSLQSLFSDAERVDLAAINGYQWLLQAQDGWLAEEDKLLRDWQREPFIVGQVFTFAEAGLEVLAINEQGNIVRALLTLPAEKAGQYVLLCWEKNQLFACFNTKDESE